MLQTLSEPTQALWWLSIHYYSYWHMSCYLSYWNWKGWECCPDRQDTSGHQEPLHISQTVHCHLRKAGIKTVVKQKHLLLSKRHRREQLDFALSHEDWTVEDWKHVIWSDKTKINCIGSDGRKWAWKRAGEGLSDRLVEGTVKFGGGSVMLWGCMTWEGVGFAHGIEDKMDADLYFQILEEL